ncbi:eukaryotic translation elongation factor 2-like [Haliotis cracherodii]|uniref:eukaryotic translation elongation factor 2-like n=1 Tax=Haliotis cracherodii TaxID=6455 RepID=UPI0039EA6E0B
MPKLDPEELQKLLSRTKNIRNVCIVGKVGQGKTLFANDIIARANDSSQGGIQGGRRGRSSGYGGEGAEDEDGLSIYDDDGGTDSEDEEDTPDEGPPLGITTCTSVRYEIRDEDTKLVTDWDTSSKEFLITLIDPDGHVDNTSEVTSALRITDGCIVVADCVTGIGGPTEAVLKLAFVEDTRPVLLLNRLDVSIVELELEPEDLYKLIAKYVWTFNRIVEVYGRPEYKVSPSEGSVAFGSALQGWAFTVHEFARMYMGKFRIEFNDMKGKLWGNNFYNQRERKWTTNENPNTTRGFIQFVLTPLYTVFNVCTRKSRDDILRFAVTMNFSLSDSEKQLKRNDLLLVLLKKWLPAGRTLLDMTVLHLPSPVTAQDRKVEILYEGSMTDDCAASMKQCDPKGCLMMYISRLVPSSEEGSLYAFGRIYSGTVRSGQKVYVRGPKSITGKKNESKEETVESVGVIYNGVPMDTDIVPCGNICGLLGVDTHLMKSGTITTSQHADTIKPIRYTVPPVVNMGIEPRQPSHLPTLMKGIKQLEKIDPRLETELSQEGELSISGVNEAHINRALEQLNQLLGKVPVKTKGPFLPYRETVTAESTEMCRSQSPNGSNYICLKAQNLPNGINDDIENGVIAPFQDARERALYLDGKYSINLTYAKKIWCFGPEGVGPNLLMDCTKGEPKYLQDIEPTVIAAFQWTTKKGVLCEEQMRGVRFNLHEVLLHADEAQRGNKEIFPAAARALSAATLRAKPRLMQPMFKTYLECPESVSPVVFEVITGRQGRVTKERSVKDWDTYYMEADIPVSKAFGLDKELSSKTDHAARLVQCTFGHWETLAGSPLDYRSKTTAIIKTIRKRKGLDPEMPSVEDFLD